MNPLYDYVFWIGNTEFPSWQDDAQGKIYHGILCISWKTVNWIFHLLRSNIWPTSLSSVPYEQWI